MVLRNTVTQFQGFAFRSLDTYSALNEGAALFCTNFQHAAAAAP
jgi:hypothetical protein